MPPRVHAAVVLATTLLAGSAAAQTPVPGPHDHALVDLDRFQALGEQAVQRGTSTGASTFNLGVATNYRLFKLERATLRVGYVEFNSGPAGGRFTIPPVPLRDQASSLDTDGDGLSDVGEFVVGSDPNDPDSDDDGVQDGAAVQAGTLSSPLLRTGLIASVRLPGDAQDVAASNDVAFVALGEGGVASANIFTRLNPIVIGLTDTPGQALRVAVSGTLVAVADGPGGLVVLDASDPPRLPIVRQVPPLLLGGHARSVAAVAGLAIVGLSTGRLLTVDLRTGLVVDDVQLGSNPITDVLVDGDAVHAVDLTTLYTLALRPGRLAVASTVGSPTHPTFPGTPRLCADQGRLRVVHGVGQNAFALADPLRPTLLATGADGQIGWRHAAVNGSGLAIGATGVVADGSGNDVQLDDARDPARPLAFVARFETPGSARAVAIHDGLGYAADGDAGLQVLSYVAQDRLGIAPTVTLSTNQPRLDRAEEGTLLRLTAACADDVQVRGCELFVDGARVEADGSFPFAFYLITPRRAERERLTLRVRVSDTGGNSTLSDPVVVELTADTTGPTVVGRLPRAGGLLSRVGGVVAYTSEPLDPASVAAGFRLTEAGPDRFHGTPDDVAIAGAVTVEATVQGLSFVPAVGTLAPGRYRASLGAAITDLAGNALTPASWSFVAYGSSASDQDGDGLPDLLELELGLDPADADSDDDGLSDGDEDRDLDGVPNQIEVILGFDLTSPDTDGDGVLDRDEDRDFDRLPDAREVALGTDPFAIDSDGDGFSDVDEALRGGFPLDPARTPVRSTVGAVAVVNRADPQATTGRALTTVAVVNQAAPEAVAGEARALPTSVRNDH